MDTAQILITAGLSVGTAWGIIRQKVSTVIKDTDKLEKRVHSLETSGNQAAVQLGQFQVAIANIEKGVDEIKSLLRRREENPPRGQEGG